MMDISYLGHVPRQAHCEIIDIDADDLDTENLQAHIVSSSCSQRLLTQHTHHSSTRGATNADTLLHTLSQLAPSVAKTFIPKQEAQASLSFRLINDVSFVGEEQSYIALSYVRKNQRYDAPKRETSSLGDLPFGWMRTVETFPLPTSRAMFGAMMQQRNENEGVWLDQVCISQDDEMEKSIAIGAMGNIYRNARVVIVALDDVAIEDDEALGLTQYIERYGSTAESPLGRHPTQGLNPPFLNQVPLLWSFIEKVLSSIWFERAWCALEMRMGRSHVFLVPCAVMQDEDEEEDDEEDSEATEFVQFNGAFFLQFLVLAAEVTPPQHRLYNRIRALLKHFSQLHFQSPQHPPSTAHGTISNVQSISLTQTNSLAHLIPEIFALKAGGNPKLPSHLRQLDANRDKISIILNLSNLPIALRPASPYDRPSIEDECLRQLLLVAIAAKDPLAMCMTGEVLRLHDGSLSWLCRPSIPAALESSSTPSLPLLLDEDVASMKQGHDGRAEYAQLPLTFLTLPHRNQPNPNRQSYVQRATAFIDTAIHHRMQTQEQNSLWNFWQINHQHPRAPALRNIFTQTLACILDCGANWVAEVWETLPPPTQTATSPLSHVQRLPIEMLDIILHPNLLLQTYILTPDGHNAISLLLNFLATLISTGIPWSTSANEITHGPLIVTPPTPSHAHTHSLSGSSFASSSSTFTPPTLSPTSSPPFSGSMLATAHLQVPSTTSNTNNGKALIFAPFAHSKTLLVAIPEALRREAYGSLARGWILTPRQMFAVGGGGAVGGAVSWELQGKCVVVGDGDFARAVEMGGADGRGRVRKEHRVFGAGSG